MVSVGIGSAPGLVVEVGVTKPAQLAGGVVVKVGRPLVGPQVWLGAHGVTASKACSRSATTWRASSTPLR